MTGVTDRILHFNSRNSRKRWNRPRQSPLHVHCEARGYLGGGAGAAGRGRGRGARRSETRWFEAW